MATYTADVAQTGVQPKALHAGANVVTGIYNLATGTPSAGDVVQMVKVPTGARIVDVLFADNHATNGTYTWEVGDGGDVNRYISSASAGTAGTVLRLNNPVGAAYSYSANDTIDVTFAAVTTATATGTISLTVQYQVDQLT